MKHILVKPNKHNWLKTHSKLTQNRREIDSKSTRNWLKTDSKMTQNRLKTDSNWNKWTRSSEDEEWMFQLKLDCKHGSLNIYEND